MTSPTSGGGRPIERRGFVQRLAAMIAAVEVGFDTIGVSGAGASELASPPQSIPALPDGAVVGIQMSPHTMLDEGIEPCLDLIQRTAAVNVVMPTSSRRCCGRVGSAA